MRHRARQRRPFGREDVLIDAQPEHYLMVMAEPHGPHVVETLGDHVVGFHMAGWDESGAPADDPVRADSSDAVDRRHSLLRLDDDGFSVEFRSWMLMAAREMPGTVS